MDALWLLLLLAIPVTAYLSAAQKAKVTSGWQRAAAQLGLTFVPPRWLQTLGMQGTLDGFLVTVDERSRRNQNPYMHFIVDSAGRIPVEVSFRGEAGWNALKKVFTGDDVLIHDPLFDQKVHVTGPEDWVCALMNERGRQAILQLASLGGAVVEGQVRLELPTNVEDPDQLVSVVRAMVEAAEVVSLPTAEIPRALAANAATEVRPEIRMRNLALLIGQHPRSPEAAAAALVALEDRSADVRLLGARLVGADERAWKTLCSLAESHTAWKQRVEAFELLSRGFPYSRTASLFGDALQSPDERVQCAAVAVIGQARDVSRLDSLCQLAATSGASLGEALAKALGSFEAAESESALVTLLAHEEETVRGAAASSLGRVGTIAAVEPLLPLTKGIRDGAVKEAARDAIRRIQGRVGSAGAGHVSLVTEPQAVGALSLAEDVGGELSLTTGTGRAGVKAN